MAQWLTDNIGNICISLVLVIVVAAIIRGIIKDKRQGKSSCGCNCSHCAMSGTCHYKKMDQQKQIKKWLISELGMSSSGRIFSAQEKILNECISSLKGKTPNQMKTLTGTILPRVALYKAFQSDSEYEPRAYELVRKYMIEVIGRQKHQSTAVLSCAYVSARWMTSHTAD